MTLTIGFWVLLTGGVMLPGSDDLLAISAADQHQRLFPYPEPPVADEEIGRVARPLRSGWSRSGFPISDGRHDPRLGASNYSRSPSSMPRMMPLAPTDPGAGAAPYMPMPPTSAGAGQYSPMRHGRGLG